LLTESGEERLVKPHPDFRIFFTMTVGAGSTVSRALRNRCIEIFVPGTAEVHESAVQHALGQETSKKVPRSLLLAWLDFLPKVVEQLAHELQKVGCSHGGRLGMALDCSL